QEGGRGPPGRGGGQGPGGETGATGPAGLTFHGEWREDQPYVASEAVAHGGQAWIAVADNTGVEPGPTSPGWALLAAKGDTGVTGASGPHRPAGRGGGPGPH